MADIEATLKKGSSFFLKIAEWRSHIDTLVRDLGMFTGFSLPDKETGAKKSNQDEVGMIRAVYGDGLTFKERLKLGYFMEWSYRVKPDRNLIVKLWLFWLRSHNKNDLRDILSNASSRLPDKEQITGQGKNERIKILELGKSRREAQRVLKEGLKLINDVNPQDDIKGMGDAARFWAGFGLPMMPRTEQIDSIEDFLNVIPDIVEDIYVRIGVFVLDNAPEAAKNIRKAAIKLKEGIEENAPKVVAGVKSTAAKANAAAIADNERIKQKRRGRGFAIGFITIGGSR